MAQVLVRRTARSWMAVAVWCTAGAALAAVGTNTGDMSTRPCEIPKSPGQGVSPQRDYEPACAGATGTCIIPSFDGGGAGCGGGLSPYICCGMCDMRVYVEPPESTGPSPTLAPDGIVPVPHDWDTDPLPAVQPVMCGSSFNGQQQEPACAGATAAATNSNGIQGYNWFQDSRPELSVQAVVGALPGEPDRAYIYTSASGLLSFERQSGSSETFIGVNANSGAVVHHARESGAEVDTYEYRNRQGQTFTFFGSDVSSSTYAGVAGQLWKVSNATGGSGSSMAYASTTQGTTTMTAAIAAFEQDGSGHRTPRVQTLFDSAGRKFTYMYTTGESSPTIGGAVRLRSIEVTVLSGSTWTPVTKAEYAYYTTATTVGSPAVTIGLAGDLKSITTTTYLSGGTSVTRQRYFRYYGDGAYNATTNPGGDHQIRMVLSAESVRRWGVDHPSTSLDSATNDNLKSYADLAATYESSSARRVWELTRNGECGCGSAHPNGKYTYTYLRNSSFPATRSGYDCVGDWGAATWYNRTTIQRPDGSYRILYCDEFGQCLAAITADGDPAGASTPHFWATRYERDGAGRVAKVYSSESITGYAYATNSITFNDTGGLVQHIEYSTASATDRLKGKVVTRLGHSKGKAGTVYVDATAQYLTTGSNWYYTHGGVDIGLPLVTSERRYKAEVDTSGLANGANYDETTHSYDAFWGAMLPMKITTTDPAVTVPGSVGSATTTVRYVGVDGRPVFLKDREDRFTFLEYDVTTAQLNRRIDDADQTDTAAATAAGSASYNVTGFPMTGGAALITQYAYDAQGRLDTTTLPSNRVTASWYTKLADGRMVVLSVPRRTGTSYTYYGPVGYTVKNQAGRTELQGVLALAGSNNDAGSIASWISTSSSDPIGAVDGTYAAVRRLSETLYNETGTRALESRIYFTIPSSLAGASSSDRDATVYGYDDMGRAWRVEDPTGTIRRTVFDKLGRVAESWIGTNDHDFTGGSASGTDDMTKVEVREYDHDLASPYIGNGKLTGVTQDADGNWSTTADRRLTSYSYDYRGRAYLTVSPVSPIAVLVKYDNRGRAVATATYNSASGLTDPNTSGGTDPASSDPQSGRLSSDETKYDEMGRAYQAIRHKVLFNEGAADGSFGSTNDQTNTTWFDAGGHVAATSGSSLQKFEYDRLGRRIRAFTLAKIDTSSYANATAIGAGDLTLEESQTIYDNATGNVLASVQLQRHHDYINSPTGALDGNADNNDNVLTASNLLTSGHPHTRAQITATWYDALDRPTATAQLGTYGLNEGSGPSAFNRGSDFLVSSVDTPPTRSDTVLVTTTAYDKDGAVLTVADPRNLATKYLYDAAGRQVAVISNYTSDSPSNLTTEGRSNDTYVRYQYEHGLMKAMWVDMEGNDTAPPTSLTGPDAHDEVTTYVHGTTKGTVGSGSPVQSAIGTGHLLREAIYPPQSSGQTAPDRTVHSAYNALGEKVWSKDQNGTIITTSLDLGGRETARIADTPGTGVSTWVRRIGLTYTDRGQVRDVVSYSDTSGSTALNGVRYSYDDFGNVTQIDQDRDSAVGTGSAYAVQFGYSLRSPSGGRQRVQRESMTLPLGTGGYAVAYSYEGGTSGTLTGLDEMAGRVTGMKIDGSSEDRVTYQYLGAGSLVGTSYPETGGVANLRHDNAAAGTAAYDALDRFNRVAIDRWTGNASYSPGTPYQMNLTYDRDSNITRAEDPKVFNGGAGTTPYYPYTTDYAMDGLNRVTAADRGRLSSGSITGETRLTEAWTLSQTGNWDADSRKINSDGDTGDTAGDGSLGVVEFGETRTHNNVNEILQRSSSGGISGTFDVKHDLAGQMIDDGRIVGSSLGRGYVYDAFGRLVEVRKVSARSGGTGSITASTALAEYRYDGLGQRIAWHRNASGGAVTSSDPWLHLVYDDRWRMVAIFHHDDAVTAPREIDVPHAAGFDGRGGSSYIDTYALRDSGGDGSLASLATPWGGGAVTLGTRHYYIQNWRADVVSLVDSAGTWPGGFKYSAYGQHQALGGADVDDGGGNGYRDGAVDVNDLLAFLGWYEAGDPRADITGDGGVDGNDLQMFLALDDAGIAGPPESRFMYAGYAFDPLDGNGDIASTTGCGIYHVRHRVYSPELGRWTRRDPLGYVDGVGLLSYVSSRPACEADPSGTLSEQLGCEAHCGIRKCLIAFYLSDIALTRAREHFSRTRYTCKDDACDAWRHCYWNCLMAKAVGLDCAEFIGTNHERGIRNPDNLMDLHNNAIGRSVALKGEDCSGGCKKALDEHRLVTSPRSPSLPSDYDYFDIYQYKCYGPRYTPPAY